MSVTSAYPVLKDEIRGDVGRDVALSRHTTWHIGGPASLFVRVDTLGSLKRALAICREHEVLWVVLGKGSNVLCSDDGFNGCVITLGGDFARVNVGEDGCLVAGAGARTSHVIDVARKAGLSGLEFLVGVPGTLGGALAMNAGSRDEWISSRLRDMVVLRPGEGVVRYGASDISWGYRESSLPSGEIILEATFELEPADPAVISHEMDRRLHRRKATQPIEVASCGSVFRNPERGSVAEMVEACGLKGYSVGDAQVSPKHANFIVNNGGARASDVLEVIRHVRDTVKEAYGTDLATEVKFLGFSS